MFNFSSTLKYNVQKDIVFGFFSITGESYLNPPADKSRLEVGAQKPMWKDDLNLGLRFVNVQALVRRRQLRLYLYLLS